MRVMGIDYGDTRIGIAVSDPFGWTAQGLDTITWNNDLLVPLQKIKKIVDQYKITKIVVGFPKNMNGTIGPSGEKTLEFIEELKKEIENIEVECWDERLTTIAAQKTLIEMGVKRTKKKMMVDRIAAVYILQGFLDNQGNKMK